MFHKYLKGLHSHFKQRGHVFQCIKLFILCWMNTSKQEEKVKPVGKGTYYTGSVHFALTGTGYKA